MTKKNIVLFSALVGTITFFLLIFSSEIGLCPRNIGTCSQSYDATATNFFLFLPILFFSLITYKLREETFRAWLHFAYWWVPLSMFLTLITPESRGGGFGPQISWGKEDTAFVFSGLFAIISLILIIYKSIKLRGK
ncbi:MAG: hypothetical protein WCT49_01070 [Candidatus Paceibacterota bacterium]|jgi:hypothetical protein|nr:hypothetical protein [Candidatus Paceibacterota bacterium]